MKRAGVFAGLGLSLLLVGGGARTAFDEFNRRIPRAETVAPFASLTDSVKTFDVDTAQAGPDERVHKLTFPEAWLDGKNPTPPLAVFVDGTRAAWLLEEPDFGQLGAERAYAYMRLPGGQSVFVACPRSGCKTVTLVRDHAATRWVLARQAEGGGAIIFAFLIFAGLAFALCLEVAKRHTLPTLVVAIGLVAVCVLPEAGSDTSHLIAAWAIVLALGTLPRLAGPARDFVALGKRSMAGETSRSATLFRVFALTTAAFLAALPGIYTVVGWYPSPNDDSAFYIFASSRFLRSGHLLSAALDPSNWKYSAFPLMMSVFAWVLRLHPADAFLVLAVVGPMALSAAAGGFAWISTGRFRTALIATLISGLWGGLGGYNWLVTQSVHVAQGGSIRFFEDDYYEPGYFGEFTGPYSEVVAYLQSSPFYPREAGLIPAWLGLALLYRRLRPDLSRPSFIPIAGLMILATAVYPYYGLTAPIALLVIAMAEGAGDEEMRRRRRLTLTALVVLSLICGVLGDVASRWYRGDSAINYLSYFLFRAPLSLNKVIPSLDFLAPRMLSGEFFFALAFIFVIAQARRGQGGLNRIQVRAAMITLVLCIIHGCLNEASPRLHLIMQNFRWFVSWRALLTPVLILCAALALERIAEGSGRRRLALVVALALLPTLSPLVWAISTREHLRQFAEAKYQRGLLQPVWESYRQYGREILGKVNLPEPLLLESPALGESSIALAAFGIATLDDPKYQDPFLDKGAPIVAEIGVGKFKSIAVIRAGVTQRTIEDSGCCSRIASYGRYDIYVRRESPSPPPSD